MYLVTLFGQLELQIAPIKLNLYKWTVDVQMHYCLCKSVFMQYLIG